MNLYISLILILCSSLLNAQTSSIEWFKHNTTKFENFDFLDKAIEGKNFLFIGESSHGAKEFFELRMQLTEYLIKNNDFEVVAIESPFMASYFYNNHPEYNSDTLTHVEHVLFPVFCNKITNSFVDSIDNWSIPLVGFDNQLGTDYQARNVTQFVFERLIKIDSAVALEYLEINPLFSKSNIVRFSTKERWFNYPCNTISDNLTCEYWLRKYDKFVEVLTSNYPELLSICNNDSLMAFATIRSVQTVQNDLHTSVNNNQLYIRDSLMAENIKFYINKVYPNKKIIFLAHNAHVSKNYHLVDAHQDEASKSMMSFLNDSIMGQSLVLGIYGIQGESNNNKRKPIKMTCTKQDSTLEFHIKNIVIDKAYIDVRNYPYRDPVNLCHWGKWPELINPKNQYDFLIFIKNITVSEYLE